MSRRRLGSFALGCLFFASYCSRGGAGSNVDVITPDMVQAEVGKTAVIKCEFSLPENGSYAYVNWYMFQTGRSTRKKIIGMIQGKVHHEKSEFKDRLNMTANFSLVIHKVIRQDAKVYVCQVGLGSLGVGENRAELHVFKTPEMPEVLETDDSITASDSKTHKIGKCVSRNGFPAPTITWYKDNEPLSPAGKEIEIRPVVTIESSGLISISSTLSAQVTKEDRDADFHCQVTYSLMGTNQTYTSKSFKINVHYPSENISFEMEAPSPVKEGDNVTLRCNADGNPEPEYNLFVLVDGEEEALTADTSGKEVFFQDIQRDQSGVYRCRAFDLQTTDDLVASLELFVNYLDVPIIIPEHPRNLREGDDLLLTCNTTSSKPLEFQWEKKGQVIARGNLLNLNNVTYAASDNYTCVATMLEEPRLSGSKQVSVGVHAKPQLAPQKELLFVRKGQKLNLTCSVFSVVKPKFSWKPGNGTIHFSNLNHQHNSTITVMVTEELLDSGINCTAKNKEGKAEHHFQMQQMPEETDPTKRPDVFPTLPGNDTSSLGYNQTAPPQTPGENDTSVLGYNQTAPPQTPGENDTSSLGYNQTAPPQTPGGVQKGTAESNLEKEPKVQESKGVIIVAVIICILVISILGAVLYFLHKKGKLPCGRSGKQEITRPEAHKDEIVVEVKSDKLPEEAVLLQNANGEKKSAGDQGERYIDLRN